MATPVKFTKCPCTVSLRIPHTKTSVRQLEYVLGVSSVEIYARYERIQSVCGATASTTPPTSIEELLVLITEGVQGFGEGGGRGHGVMAERPETGI